MSHAIPARSVRIDSTSTIRDPAVHAYWILRIGFALLPIVAGADKFMHVLTDWEVYLAPWVANLFGGDAHNIMLAVGVVEIIAGIGVAFAPRFFAYVVAAWLLGIIINLVSMQAYYDIALRDAGLMLGALALGQLSHWYAHLRPRAPAVA